MHPAIFTDVGQEIKKLQDLKKNLQYIINANITNLDEVTNLVRDNGYYSLWFKRYTKYLCS